MMRLNKRTVLAVLLALFAAIAVTACGESRDGKGQKETIRSVQNERDSFPQAYVPHNHVEFNNFNEAQRLYDTPSTILWCTSTWGNPSAPLFTVPIAGKLTSSSVSYLPQDYVDEPEGGKFVLRQSFSNDGMYHGSPPPYRYGFTPGHQYADYSNMPVYCTTALTEFQRQKTEVSIAIDQSAKRVTERAEAVLKAGTDPKTKKISPAAAAKAQAILLEAKIESK